jgi:hypothetical protein
MIALLVAAAGLSLVNPYLAEVSKLSPEYTQGGCRNPGNNPMPNPIDTVRTELVNTYSWAIPTTDAITAIADFSDRRVIDFGAGSGYWAHLLAERGVDVVAVDDWSWGRPEHTWHPVETGSFERLASATDRALLMVWPPRNEMPLKALREWRGDHLIYVGEILRGNGTIRFFDVLDREWVLVRRIDIPQWWNRSDAVYLLARGPARPWTDQEAAACLL